MALRLTVIFWLVLSLTMWASLARDWTSVLLCLIVTVLPLLYFWHFERRTRRH